MGWRGEALLARRNGRNTPNGVSFLITFFFAPLVSKKKVAKELRLFRDGRTQFAPTVEQGEHVDCERKFVRFRVVEFSLRLGHARVLTPHRGVIHYARAALLRRPLQLNCAYGVKETAAKGFRRFKGGRPMVAPTIEQGEHVDCERKFVRFRTVGDCTV